MTSADREDLGESGTRLWSFDKPGGNGKTWGDFQTGEYVCCPWTSAVFVMAVRSGKCGGGGAVVVMEKWGGGALQRQFPLCSHWHNRLPPVAFTEVFN